MVPLYSTSQLPDVVVAEALAQFLDKVPDPRKPKGKRYRIGPILCLAVCGMLCGSRSLYAKAAYAITSLWPHEADAGRLLSMKRGHWRIENCLHYVRDVTYGEDKSQVRTGNAPRVMAALRNTAIGVMRLSGTTNIASALRRDAARPREALNLLGIDDTST
jgi:hypothetical protein